MGRFRLVPAVSGHGLVTVWRHQRWFPADRDAGDVRPVWDQTFASYREGGALFRPRLAGHATRIRMEP